MKKENVEVDDVSLYVKGIVKPIFDKVLQETNKNPLSVGGGGSKSGSLALYQPHNYRLYIDFKKDSFNPKQYIKPTPLGWVGVTHKLINNNSEHQYKDLFGCRLTIKKNQVEIQNCIEPKKTYLIESTEKAEQQILKILQTKDKECLNALKELIKQKGGSSKFEILKRHSENKIYGTDSINALPIKEKFHNKILKKVYNEQNIEYSDPVFVVNHLINSGVVEVVPSIVKSIEMLSYNINPLRTVKSFLNNLNDVFKYKNLIEKLSNKERKELSVWLSTLQEV